MTFMRSVDVIDEKGNEIQMMIESENKEDLEYHNIVKYIYRKTGRKVKLASSKIE